MNSFKQEIDPLKSLWENYRFIKKSLHEFDNGDESESKRIAVNLRSLFHSEKSILNQVDKNSLELYDTRTPKFSFNYNIFEGMKVDIVNLRNENMPYYALNCRRFYKEGDKYLLKNYPLYSHRQFKLNKTNKMQFSIWWNQEIFDNLNGDTLSREQLVKYVSNKEGVAHLGRDQTRNYRNYKIPQNLEVPVDGEFRVFEHLTVASTLAQIAYEVVQSFEDNEGYINS